MVNNWAMELQQHTIEFEYIQGVKNTLADTMSRLVKITPDIEKEPEKPEQEFGRFIFEKIDHILVENSHARARFVKTSKTRTGQES